MTKRTHELTFSSNVAHWITSILESRSDLPFTKAEIERSAPGRRKRRDLTVYDKDGNKALTGEIKMPDAPDGRSPYAEDVVKDAFQKASEVNAKYFFTWNVNRFVLWDPFKEAFLLQRQCRDYPLLNLTTAADIEKPWVVTQLRDKFLPEFLEELARLYRGEEVFGVLPPDEQFIKMLESFLERPVALTTADIFKRYYSDKAFKRELDKWMVNHQGWTVSSDEEHMKELLDRAAKLSCFVLSNKLIFYEALRRRFPELKPLTIPNTVDNVDRMLGELDKFFSRAQEVTKDYETLFWPDDGAKLPLLPLGAIDAWRTLIKQISQFNLKDLEHDVLGPIFERLIDPEERHKFGQHYTKPTVVDLINAFCIRKPDAAVMDPACGSGTFLIRAYARKKWMSGHRLDHKDLITQLYGSDISGFAAHLSCVGLASKELIEAQNYPRVLLDDFFNLRPHGKASLVPGGRSVARTLGLGKKTQVEVQLPEIDAGVGNPPYIRQEEIPKAKSKKKPAQGTKDYYQQLVKEEAPTFNLSGRSDIYVYFWPHLAAFLKQNGYLGLLTSSSWLDVEYGFRLQEWFLNNFRIVAILESVCEPWFTGARVATAVTIVQRCSDEEERMDNLVHFVQLRVPLTQLLANDGTEDGRQRAADSFRDLIEGMSVDTRTDEYRILVVPQSKLWEDGCRLGKAPESEDEEDETEKQTEAVPGEKKGTYKGGKWGVYLRAPDLYFEIMQDYGKAFVPIGQIAEVRFGVKSGCDHFFYPRDYTTEALSSEPEPKSFKDRYGVTRRRVESGKVKVVRAGDGSVWPIEADYLEKEIHNLMVVNSPRVKESELNRFMLIVDQPPEKIKRQLVYRYIRHGEKETFGGNIPVSKRPTCASREGANRKWYDLAPGWRGQLLWSIAHGYRHIVPFNYENVVCNKRLFKIRVKENGDESKVLCAILNSTLMAMFKQHYGRIVGREGHLDTEVIDINLMPVPDPSTSRVALKKRLGSLLDSLAERDVGMLLEKSFWGCKRARQAEQIKDQPIAWPDELKQLDRQELDDAVLELIGVADPEKRRKLRERLYDEVTMFYRQVRLLELQAIENKLKSKRKVGVTAKEIAEDIWGELEPKYKRRFPEGFLQDGETLDTYSIEEGKARLIDDMFIKATLGFKSESISFRHLPQAQLALTVAEVGRDGPVSLPYSEERCKQVLKEWKEFLPQLESHLFDKAFERTPDEDKAEAAVKILLRRIQETKPD